MKKTGILFATALLAAGLTAAPAAARGPAPKGAAKIAQDANFGERALININNMALWFKSDGNSAHNPFNGNAGVTFPRSTDQVIYQDGFIWGGRVKDGDPQELRVGGQTYDIGTVPGAIVSKGVAEDPNDPSVRIYRVRRDYQTADLRLDTSEMLGIGLSEVTDAQVQSLRDQYTKDWNEWPVHKGAPFYDRDGDGTYNPQVDEPSFQDADCTVDEARCASNADQVAWFVINDLDLGAATSLYGAKPIGFETQITMWAYARTDALGDAIFKKYKVIYKGTANTPDDAVVEDMYFSQWSDPDLGDFGDDYAGADVDLSLGYVYNANATDSNFRSFELAPPAAGYDFLQGPIVPVFVEDDEGNQVLDTSSEAIFDFQKRPGYKNLPMTAFVYFAAGSAIDDPELGEYKGTLQWYNLLRGFQPQEDIDNPVPFTNPLTGADTKFTLDGDPTRAQGWNDGVPLPAGDRRMVLATGPIQMALGDTQEVVVALLGASSTDRLRSVAKLKFNDQFVQDAYNNFFQVPSPPSAPQVRLIELDKTIILDWGWDPNSVTLTEEGGSAPFEFEGYNVYQLPSAESPLSQGTRVATFDKENGVTTVLGIDLDERSGVILDVPLQLGSDFGVRRNLKITQDAIKGRPLVNGQRYYFAVTAYNRNTEDGAATTTLESPPQTIICVPQDPPPGVRFLSEPGEVLSGEHTAGVSDGSVQANVVDPTRTTGDTYKVDFGATADGETVWSLVNVTKSELIMQGQTDQSGAAHYVGTDGFEISVSGPPAGMKDWDIPTGDRWWTWAEADWGAEGFQGAITGDPNHQWFAPTTVTPDRLRTVEVRFTSVNEEDGENQYKPLDLQNPNVSYAYRYLRGAGGDPPALGDLTTTQNPWDFGKYIINTAGPGVYVYQDRVPIALSAWDVEADPPRRLEVAFLENNQPGGLVNGAYGPAFYNDIGNITSSGPREWLFIFDLEYTDPTQGQNSQILLDNGLITDSSAGEDDLPFMWIVFAGRRRVDRFPQDGDSFLLEANHVNTAADEFTFTVPGSLASDEFLNEDIKRINVFPNPYFGVNQAETSRFNKFVTFNHLPPRVKIRIFDLSGTLVRTLEKESADQFLRWDLNNDNQLPVASGMYVAHIDMPGVNKTRILKLAVVQEQQFLENF